MPTTDLASTLTIGQVARRAGVRDSHIRYYERIGVLPHAQRVSGQRRYTDDVLRRLAIVDVAQRAGLSLGEIRDLTGPSSRDRRASERIPNGRHAGATANPLSSPISDPAVTALRQPRRRTDASA